MLRSFDWLIHSELGWFATCSLISGLNDDAVTSNYIVQPSRANIAMRYRREFVTSAPMSCHASSRGPMRMRTNVVDFRVMQRLYRRKWNWLCVNQHPWQRTRGHGVWRLTSIAHCQVSTGTKYLYIQLIYGLVHRELINIWERWRQYLIYRLGNRCMAEGLVW